MPDVQQNKQIVQQWYDNYSAGNIDGLIDLHADDLVTHALNSPFPEQHAMQGKQAGRELFTKHRAAFPDWREEIHFMVAEDDKVTVFHTGTGTHRGEFAGHAPTNRQVSVTAMDIVRIDDNGKFVEHWGVHPWQQPVQR
jgi:steroid delta-isomerase-like uncharacterized protein